jgi:hypothetical protein
MRKGVIVRTLINNFTFDGSQTDPKGRMTTMLAEIVRWS